MTPVTFSTLSKTHKTLLIIALFTVLGSITLLIKNTAENAQYEKAKLYNTAIHASSTAAFNYAVDSQQGYILTYGTFTTPEPVTHPDITGGYFSISKVEEEYTRHIEYYECGTEEDPETCTRTYYSWDYNGSDDIAATTLTLHERNYPASIFSIPYSRHLNCDVILINCHYGYHYADESWFASEGDIRYYYRVTDTTFSGSIFVNTYNGQFIGATESIINIRNQSVEDRIKEANSTTGITILIVILFIINLGFCIIIYKENVHNQY